MRILIFLGLAGALAMLTGAACGSSDSNGTSGDAGYDASPGSRTPCSTSAPCIIQGELCSYPVADACQAKGLCLQYNPSSRGVSCASHTVCGCDGKTASLNNECPYPSGYASVPYAYAGSCAADGGADGGP